jgi:hypothetical protein
MAEQDSGWRKSSHSVDNGGANCVELGSTPGAILIRDTKNHGTGPVLRLTLADWTRFAASIKR